MSDDILKKCRLCPRNCLVNRYVGCGFCGATSDIKLARADLHYYEEPSISGISGSGTIFFSGCNLRCVFCQNYRISNKCYGKFVSIDRLANIFLELQDKGADNINLVTGTPYIPHIVKALDMAKKKGLVIPIIYNSSGYESVVALKMLDGYIDVYLPDMKYYDNKYGLCYSKCDNYFGICKDALNEMYRQVGSVCFDKNGLIKKGMIVRHLVMPNMVNDSKMIIKYLYDSYGDNIYISIMNQYTPNGKLNKYKKIDRVISESEYDEVINYAIDIGVNNAYIQEGDTADESFIPKFDLTGI